MLKFGLKQSSFAATILPLFLFLLSTESQDVIPTIEWYVDPENGSDSVSNPGTQQTSPFQSIQRCVDAMVANSQTAPPNSAKYENDVRGRCVLSEGVYSPSLHTGRGIVIEGLKGEPNAIYEIAPSEDASVTFVGYDEVMTDNQGWTHVEGTPSDQPGPSIGHWKATVTNDFSDNQPWQLFVDEEMYVPARWPDAKFDADSIFSASTWAKTTKESLFKENTNQDSTVVEKSGDLAASGMDVTDASIVVNNKHWFTFTTVVTDHEPNSGKVFYRKQPKWKGDKWVAGSDIFYLENKPEFISTETEWHYDDSSGELLVAFNMDPNEDVNVGLRVQEYAFRITSTTDLRLRDLKFVGTTVYAASTSSKTTIHGIVFDSLQFLHPSAMKRSVVGNHVNSWPTTLYEKILDVPCRNVIFNCTFMGNEGHPTTHLRGSGLQIDNNLFQNIDYTAVTTVPCRAAKKTYTNLQNWDPGMCDPSANYVGGGTALQVGHSTVSKPANVTRNTIDTYGGSSGLTVGKNAMVYMNRISGAKDIQLDGALVQSGGHDRYETGDHSNRWSPPLCPDFKFEDSCLDAKCDWSSQLQICQGNPSEGFLSRTKNLPPDDALDGSSYFGTHYSHNWVYDASNDRATKRALRFDRAQHICNGRFDNTWANHGSMTYNVAFNTNGLMVKGSGLDVTHNTVFGTGGHGKLDSEGSNVRDMTVYDAFNEGTCQCGGNYCQSQPTTCCVDGDDATFEGKTNAIQNNLLGGTNYDEIDENSIVQSFPGPTSENNVAGPDVVRELRDVDNFDFRPKASATAVGAYDADDAYYWIPGRREWIASSPVPPNGANKVQLDADLMFLPRLARGMTDDDENDDTHVVHAACSPELLDTDSAYKYVLEKGKNIAPMPEELARAGRTIYWRVDTQPAASSSSSVLRGNVWEYTYIDPYSDENAQPEPPGRCKTFSAPIVDLSQKQISPQLATVSEITIDAEDYDKRYTLSTAKVCIGVTDATLGISPLQLRLVTKKGNIILKRNKEGGNGDELVRTCFTDDATQKRGKGSLPFGGEWRPKKGSIDNLVEHYPGTSFNYAKMKVKDHVNKQNVGRTFPGTLEWSIELCFDGWESPHDEWLENEEKRIQQKENEKTEPWCAATETEE